MAPLKQDPRHGRLHAMSVTRNQYQEVDRFKQRLAYWQDRCIPCGVFKRQDWFHPARKAEPCQYERHQERFQVWYKTVRFDAGIGCVKCALPEDLCRNQGRGHCDFSQLVLSICYFLFIDKSATWETVCGTIGGRYPRQSLSTTRLGELARFAGTSANFYGRPACKAVLVAHHFMAIVLEPIRQRQLDFVRKRVAQQ